MTFKGWTLHDLKAHTSNQWLNVRSPLRLLIIITSMVFLSDATVMLLIALLPPLPFLVVALLDSLLVVLLLFPSLYIFVFRQSRLQITKLLKANERLETQITERKRAEEALQKSQEKRRLLIEMMNEGLAIIDENGMCTYVNGRFCEMLGYAQEKIIGHPATDLLDEENRKIFKEQKEKRRKGEKAPYEMSYLRGDGQRVFVIISPRPIFDGDGRFKGSFAIVTDITELKQTEASLRESEAELRYLSSQLLTAQESERRRISRELHDELGQSLALLKLQLSLTRKRLPEALQHQYEEQMHYIDQIIENVRRLSRDLRPAALDDLGLSAALQWVTKNFEKNFNIRVTVDPLNIDSFFPHDAQIMIYRVFQEALTNVGKHAGAKNVSVAIEKREDWVSFVIEDDGKGFNLTKALTKSALGKGLGLSTMDERIRMLKGSLNLWSQEGAGTRITFTIPINNGRPMEKGENPQ